MLSKQSKLSFFWKNVLPLICENFACEVIQDWQHRFYTQQWGRIDYFPISGKLYFLDKDHWKRGGLKWITENLITNK
jgi:hypothetical protein